MAITHIMQNRNWNNGFATDQNAILVRTVYEPEILIVGTYNPNTPENNTIADFFYGRNYFWPAFYNLKNNNPELLQQRRDVGHLPMLPDLFELCAFFKLTFADLIRSTMHNGAPFYVVDGNIVNFGGEQYNLIEDNALAELNQLNQVEWNVDAIITYLTNTPSIHTVYFTRQPTGAYQQSWLSLVNHLGYGRNVEFHVIYTPRGSRLHGTPRIRQLTKHWLWNENPNYSRINHQYLINKQVDPNLFLN